MSDIDLAYRALVSKRAKYEVLWAYYEGDHPLKYSTERLRELFNDMDIRFVENWCAVVINAVYDRMELDHFDVANNEDLSKRLNQLVKKAELDLDADDIHLASLVCGESFLVVWKNEVTDDQGQPVTSELEAYYHDPRMCHIEYNPEQPRQKQWAAKWWEVVPQGQSKKFYRVNLYYPDRLEYWQSTKPTDQVKSGDSFEQIQDPAENPFGQVPIFHFRRDRRKVISELADILTLQDAINKLLSDLMVSSEFTSLMERYVVTNASVGNAQNSPDRILVIPKGTSEEEPTKVGNFEAMTLDTFLKSIDKLAYAAGVITRTPRHYFYDQGGDPSGEALITMEAPLVKKTKRFIRRHQNTWQRVAAFMLLVADGVDIDPEEIDPVFIDPETVQPKTQAEIRKINIDCGLPLVTILRREGWNEEELHELETDKADADAADSNNLAKALMKAERTAQQREGQQGMKLPGVQPPSPQEPVPVPGQ